MKYELFSVGNGQTLVSYSDGKMEIISDEKLAELPVNSPDSQESEVLFSDLINKMIIEYGQAKENNTSIAGERVYIQTISEIVKWSPNGVDFLGEYEVIGSNSKVSKSIQRVEVNKLVPAWKNIHVIYRTLLQLWASGCHATIEDEHNFRTSMERRH